MRGDIEKRLPYCFNLIAAVGGSVFSLVIKAYRAPFDDLAGIWGSFRLVIFYILVFGCTAYGVLNIVIFTNPGVPLKTLLVNPLMVIYWIAVLAAAIYGFALFISGTIAWHKRLIGADKHASGEFPLTKTRWSYFGYMVLVYFIAVLLGVSFDRAINSIVEFPNVQKFIYLFPIAHPIFLVFAIIILTRKILLRLPIIAIEGRSSHVSRRFLSGYTMHSPWLLALFCVAFPIFGGSLLSSYLFHIMVATDYIKQFLPVSDEFMHILMFTPLMTFLKQGLALYLWAVLTSFLTFYYRDYLREEILKTADQEKAAEA